MHKHKEAQEGHVELNIGGYRFQTSVQALRRVPHTFFDAYFSGRYAQDVCRDGSIFVDRDGEHFGHILQYMRDGVVSVAEPDAHLSVSLLRALKREFGFYCIELCADQMVEHEQPEVAYVVGGSNRSGKLSSMERYDASSGQWSMAAAMGTARSEMGACVMAGELYVSGGFDSDGNRLSTVEKYSPSNDTWSVVAPMPLKRGAHAAVVVGSAMYVLGGVVGNGVSASVLRFDSMQGTWSEITPMPAARRNLAACSIGSDIYVLGGEWNARAHPSVFKFDTEADEWSTLAPMPHASNSHSVSVLNGLIFLVGAKTDGSSVLRFDPASNAWSTLAPTSMERNGGVSFVMGGFLYAAGGLGQTSSVERYDVATNTWTIMANMLEARRYFCAVTIGSVGPVEEQDLFDSLIAKSSRRRP
jgi:N-acetylneuraminic acid mutarotase